jgi:hypothetical protein
MCIGLTRPLYSLSETQLPITLLSDSHLANSFVKYHQVITAF